MKKITMLWLREKDVGKREIGRRTREKLLSEENG